MYSSNLFIGATIPQGMLLNNTCRQFTYGSLIGKISSMPQFTPEQHLLMHIRDTYCGGVAAELARKIGKDGTYVHRLFYPIDKKARKGIGLEIMKTCSSVFGLAPGFWDTAEGATPQNITAMQAQTNQASAPNDPWWPFSDKVKPWQYNQLSEPPQPANNKLEGTYG